MLDPPRLTGLRAAAPVRPGDHRDFMSRFPTGVAVVTALDGAGTPWGCTCSSLCSVSLRPPVLAVCLARWSRTLRAVGESRGMGVNIVGADGQAIAELFASMRGDQFDRVRWRPLGGSGLPVIDAAIAFAECKVTGTHEMGDHVVVFGTVMSVECRAGVPLLHGLRGYAVWPGAGVPRAGIPGTLAPGPGVPGDRR